MNKSIQRLSSLYKKHKIRFIKPQYTYCRKERGKAFLSAQKQETVMEITELMQTGKQVVYVDETQFHKQQLKERAWIRREMTLRKPDGRGSGVNVIGAIREKQGLVHYTILRETNKTDTFANFVSELVRKIKGEAYIYMDNLSVHTSAVVKSHFNERVK